MKKPVKMKGSPMQRNFGIGSPLKNDKKKAHEATRNNQEKLLKTEIMERNSKGGVSRGAIYRHLHRKAGGSKTITQQDVIHSINPLE